MKTILVLAAAALLLVAACGQAATSNKVTVTMDEWSIKLDQSSVPAGKVTFAVKNAGREGHELALLKTDIAPDKLALRASNPAKAEEPGNVGEIEDISAGATKEATFDLTPGRYVLICNEPGHYVAGMRIPGHYVAGMRIAFVVR